MKKYTAKVIKKIYPSVKPAIIAWLVNRVLDILAQLCKG